MEQEFYLNPEFKSSDSNQKSPDPFERKSIYYICFPENPDTNAELNGVPARFKKVMYLMNRYLHS